MTKSKVFKIFLVFLGMYSLSRSELTKAEKFFVPRVPPQVDQYENISFYLLTAGVGSDLASRFGHTGIRINDPYLGLDVVYNWGKFSFNTPGFGWKFFRGSLTYSMGVRTYKNDVEIYQDLGRSLVMEPMRLTNQQKMALYGKIAYWAQPANREFQYQYWYKNCSTIPRDLIDEALHGAVYNTYSKQPAGKVFRDYVRLHLSAIPFVVPGLDIMMNGQIDRPITKWEEMFLPGKLREQLQQINAVDDQGKFVEGTRFLGQTEVLVDRPEFFETSIPDYFIMILPLGLLLTGSIITLTRKTSFLGRPYSWLGWTSIYYGVLYGIWGCVLLFNWSFSGHSDGWANKNLIFFWPTDLFFIYFGAEILKRNESIKNRFIIPNGLTILGVLKVFCSIFYALLFSGHMIHGGQGIPLGQDMSRILFWFGSPTMVFIPLFLYYGVLRGPQAVQRSRADSKKMERPKSYSVKTP